MAFHTVDYQRGYDAGYKQALLDAMSAREATPFGRRKIADPKTRERVTARRLALAAGTRSAETNEDLAQSEGCQSGPKGNAQPQSQSEGA